MNEFVDITYIQSEHPMHPIVKQCLAENIRPCEQCDIYHRTHTSKKLCELCRKDWKFSHFEKWNNKTEKQLERNEELIGLFTKQAIKCYEEQLDKQILILVKYEGDKLKPVDFNEYGTVQCAWCSRKERLPLNKMKEAGFKLGVFYNNSILDCFSSSLIDKLKLPKHFNIICKKCIIDEGVEADDI